MNTIKFHTDVDEQAHEAALAIERGMPVEMAEILVAPIAISPTSEDEGEYEFVGTLTREQALHLREIEADRRFDRRFGLA